MRNNNSVYSLAKELNHEAITRMNQYLFDVMRTRGGRVGSGMGTVLETLWGYNINKVLSDNGHSEFEIAWFPDHQYHDFACVLSNATWSPNTQEGEFFRIEAKSMIHGGADEPKAHFDVLQQHLNADDAILLIIWQWATVDEFHVCPQVIDCFFDRALPVAKIRDKLHLARGGSFVDSSICPDGCEINDCVHGGEPLNADGKRERKGGPEQTRVSAKTSHAQNFGGMLRMLKTATEAARLGMRAERQVNVTGDAFVDFIHRNFPKEELNHYTPKEWKTVAKVFNIDTKVKADIHTELLKLGRDLYLPYMPR